MEESEGKSRVKDVKRDRDLEESILVRLVCIYVCMYLLENEAMELRDNVVTKCKKKSHLMDSPQLLPVLPKTSPLEGSQMARRNDSQRLTSAGLRYGKSTACPLPSIVVAVLVLPSPSPPHCRLWLFLMLIALSPRHVTTSSPPRRHRGFPSSSSCVAAVIDRREGRSSRASRALVVVAGHLWLLAPAATDTRPLTPPPLSWSRRRHKEILTSDTKSFMVNVWSLR